MFGPLGQIYQIRDLKTKRISSFDRSGGNRDYIRIESGETSTIADIRGAGIIKHIWITIASDDPMLRRNAIIRMHWDMLFHIPRHT